jgi:hypothetical protein
MLQLRTKTYAKSNTISHAFPCALMLRFERAKTTIMKTHWRRRWSLYV